MDAAQDRALARLGDVVAVDLLDRGGGHVDRLVEGDDAQPRRLHRPRAPRTHARTVASARRHTAPVRSRRRLSRHDNNLRIVSFARPNIERVQRATNFKNDIAPTNRHRGFSEVLRRDIDFGVRARTLPRDLIASSASRGNSAYNETVRGESQRDVVAPSCIEGTVEDLNKLRSWYAACTCMMLSEGAPEIMWHYVNQSNGDSS